MAQVTGGKVSFSRTVQATQYEPQRAEVELTFALPEGEELGNTLDLAAKIAADKVYEMLKLKRAAGGPTIGDKVVQVLQETKTSTADKNAAKEAYAAKQGVAETLDLTPGATHQVEPPKTRGKKNDKPASDPDLDILGSGDTVAVTDAQLMEAVTQTNAKLKQPAKIIEIRNKYTGGPPKTIKDIPADKRQEFLTELAKLVA